MFLSGIKVRPPMMEKEVVPELPDKNTLLTLISPPKDSDPLRIKKFELDGLRPFSVKPIAIAVDVAPVFFMIRNFVAYPKFISLI